MNSKQIVISCIILGALLGGATSAIMKVGLQEVPTLSFVFLRFLIASLVVLPFYLYKKRNIIKDLAKVGPLSMLAVGNVFFFSMGVNSTTATISQLLYAAIPLFTGIILYFFFKERIGRRKTLGIIVGFLGVMFIVFLPVIQSNAAFSGDMLGNILISIAVICYSFYLTYSKKMLSHASPFIITSIFIFIATVILFPGFLFDLSTQPQWISHISWIGIVTILYTAIIVTIFAYMLNQYAIKHGGSVYASLTFYLQPLFGYLVAALLLGEQLTTGILLGGAIILAGITIVLRK